MSREVSAASIQIQLVLGCIGSISRMINARYLENAPSFALHASPTAKDKLQDALICWRDVYLYVSQKMRFGDRREAASRTNGPTETEICETCTGFGMPVAHVRRKFD
ncbi:hypothetical protein HN011_011743 [Eciton burchellii]|jgi:hypothetical protein|nr:hypothetical protein HN011_011743 [Eciton burchellii]